MSGRVVFGDDGSAGADVAWLWINEQRWPGWELHVLTCEVPPIGPPPGEEAASPRPWDPPEPRPAFAEAGFDSVAYLRVEADPRYALAAKVPADLVVVGAKGRGALKALHLGSTTEFLLQGPPVPLVVVRHAVPVRRVVVAVDGSVHSRRAAETAAALPWIDGADVVLVAVRDGRADVDTALGEAAELFPKAEPRAVDLDRSVAETILGAADGADLFCLGTRGLGAFRRTFVGSTASALASLAPRSLIVAHAE